MLSLVLLTALSGCSHNNSSSNSNSGSGSEGSSQTDPNRTTVVKFWTGFGNNVNGVLTELIKRFEEIHPTVKVEYSPQSGGYNALRQAITSSISNNAFPHIANGYPDHFAIYANSQIVLNLNTKNNYINHPEFGVDVDQYLPDYMRENMELAPPAITGLPFNKSTEVMVSNQSFFDVAKLFDAAIKVPETWQELAVIGKKLKDVAKAQGWFGKLVKHDGSTAVLPKEPTKEQIAELIPQVAFDMTLVKEEEFVPFSWDSGANFFITILRQWGSQYTKQGDNFQSGRMVFHDPANKAKTVAALKYFQDLHKARIVGIPATFAETLFSSKPFKEGKLVMTISSSAGIASNMPIGTTDFPFEVSVNKLPYNADLPDNKYVISQGTNLGLFSVGKANDAKVKLERDAAWRLLRFLTYEVNHEFGKGTAYFPVTDGSKLAVDENDQRYKDYKLYKDFLAEVQPDKSSKAIQDTANVQAKGYQAKDENGVQIWKQFVDPGFLGSSRIRDEVDKVMGLLFGDGLSPDLAIKGVLEKLPDYV